MDVNDNACNLTPRGVLGCIASELTPAENQSSKPICVRLGSLLTTS